MLIDTFFIGVQNWIDWYAATRDEYKLPRKSLAHSIMTRRNLSEGPGTYGGSYRCR